MAQGVIIGCGVQGYFLAAEFICSKIIAARNLSGENLEQ